MMGIDSKDDTFRKRGYPMMEIGSLSGEACDPEILEFFAKQVEIYFGFTPKINSINPGGYVPQKHGRDVRGDLNKSGKNPNKRNVLQIELGRYLYMKESTQKIDHEQAEKVGVALRICRQRTGEKFGKEHFQGLE